MRQTLLSQFLGTETRRTRSCGRTGPCGVSRLESQAHDLVPQIPSDDELRYEERRPGSGRVSQTALWHVLVLGTWYWGLSPDPPLIPVGVDLGRPGPSWAPSRCWPVPRHALVSTAPARHVRQRVGTNLTQQDTPLTLPLSGNPIRPVPLDRGAAPTATKYQDQHRDLEGEGGKAVEFRELPVKFAVADTDGISNALDVLASTPEDARDVAQLLEERPIDVIRRVLTLNRYQRAGLAEMTDDELKELVRPVLEVLRSDDPGRLRGVRLVERLERQSPVRIRCQVEVEW